MCFGGGGSQATIQKPDYSAFNKQFDLQKSAIDQQMSNSSMLLQTQLQETLQQQNIVRQQIRDVQVAKAENEAKLEEEAQRLSVLVGTPPPEPTAEAPVIGDRDRGMSTRKGKGSLRISRQSASSNGQGAGLNIT